MLYLFEREQYEDFNDFEREKYEDFNDIIYLLIGKVFGFVFAHSPPKKLYTTSFIYI